MEIETESGVLLYYIPIENSDEFVEEVNKRILALQENNESFNECKQLACGGIDIVVDENTKEVVDIVEQE